MKHLDDYVETLYQNANPRLQETIDLKEETRTHLEQSIRDLMLAGRSETEATRIALERFGGMEQADSIIKTMQIQQNRFAKRLLQIGVGALLSSMLVFIISLFIGGSYDLTFADAVYLNVAESTQADAGTAEAILQESGLIHSVTMSPTHQTGEAVSVSKRWSGAVGLISNKLSYLENDVFTVINVIDPRRIGLLLLLTGLIVLLRLVDCLGCHHLTYTPTIEST
ncbi:MULTISPECIES: permease prefix domain 1-containing protein [Exiguobacterium]|uniref:permease prefix domain 1-containing protein n=1 Tax=Exiguobacterium TaxID=33986 RepID=UPI001BE598FB|nr:MULTISPECIES: permease prefix domain 1-containing protein [Exiguobacterium]MCT4782113.1 permease prefix domain 1-containing protein [Exiguobacterium himgiriensis]